MRGLDSYERAIVNQLYAIGGEEKSKNILHFWRQPQQQPEFNTSLFSQLRSAGAIGALAPFVLHPNKDVASAALQQIEHLLSKQVSVNINWVDETIRSMFYFCQGRGWAQGWQKANGSTISNLPFEGRELVTALTLLACHNNGFARMQAIRRLALVDIEGALKLAFVRANDWVNPVSQAALDIINECLPKLQEKQLVQYLHLVDQLQNKNRRNLEPIRAAVKNQLKTEAGYNALAATVSGKNYRSARLAFQLLAEYTSDVKALVRLAIESKDVVIRGQSLELIKQLSGSEERLVLLEKLAGDIYSPLAKRALYAATENFPKESENLLIKNLLHTNKGVRDICRFYLKRSSEINFVEIYLANLHSNIPSTQTAAILGVSEVGSAEHWDIIRNAINTSNPRISSAIVKAAENLGCKPANWFEEKLIEGSLSESRAASDALSQDDNYLAQDLRTLLEKAWNPTRLRYILNIARRKDKWGYLGVMLAAFIKVGVEEDYGLEQELNAWLSRHHQQYWFVKPDQKILDDLLMLIEQTRSISEIKVLISIEAFVTQVNESHV